MVLENYLGVCIFELEVRYVVSLVQFVSSGIFKDDQFASFWLEVGCGLSCIFGVFVLCYLVVFVVGCVSPAFFIL